MANSFETIIQAAETARSQFSILSTEADNAEVLKEMATAIFRAFYGLVEDANGDPDIISTWIDGVQSDLDYAFADAIEKREETVSVFRPRRGLGLVVHGARL